MWRPPNIGTFRPGARESDPDKADLERYRDCAAESLRRCDFVRDVVRPEARLNGRTELVNRRNPCSAVRRCARLLGAPSFRPAQQEWTLLILDTVGGLAGGAVP